MISSGKGMAPYIQYLAKWGVSDDSRPLLKCAFGWSPETTRQFLIHEFEDLSLRAMQDQTIDIPPLGEKADSIKCLLLDGPGKMLGLEQFKFIEILGIDSFPCGGIDFISFPRLQEVAMTWDRNYSSRIFGCFGLRGLDITEGFDSNNCEGFDRIVELRRISFTGGKIINLSGLENLSQLTSITIAAARSFSTFGDLAKYPNLVNLDLDSLPKLEWDWKKTKLKSFKSIALENLPTLHGTFDFTGCEAMEEIRIVKCPNLVADIGGLSECPNLQTLWLNVAHIGLNVEDLFSRSKLRFFGLIMLGQLAELDDVALHELAGRHGRKIKSIDRTGPRKSLQLQVFFE